VRAAYRHDITFLSDHIVNIAQSIPKAGNLTCAMDTPDVSMTSSLGRASAQQQPSSLVRGTSPSDIQQTNFLHERLNLTKASIRLVEVLPADGSGSVQCKVRHATIEAEYTCVSYVWGPAEDTHTVFLNGKPFLVRRNIWEFLMTVSSAIGSEQQDGDGDGAATLNFQEAAASLWIDALCIDQDDNGERNHQVQQMGEIFKGAHGVVAWLGQNPRYASLFHYMRETLEKEHFFNADYYLSLYDFCQDIYWKRAWVCLPCPERRIIWNHDCANMLHIPDHSRSAIGPEGPPPC
jgi:hypothetical protein